MLDIDGRLAIPDDELVEKFVRAAGPGGQNVNKVASAVELRFDIRQSPSLPESLRERLLQRRDRRLTADGVMVIQAQRYRDQARNREDARERLADFIRAALHVPKARIATRPRSNKSWDVRLVKRSTPSLRRIWCRWIVVSSRPSMRSRRAS